MSTTVAPDAAEAHSAGPEEASDTGGRRLGQRQDLLRTLLLAGGTVLTLLITVWTLRIGAGGITTADAAQTLWDKLTGGLPATPEELRIQTTVWELRVPRAGLALLGGAALAIAGTLFQGLLRNPLVSPFTLGIAPAAAFGASMAILFAGGGTSSASLVGGALISGILCAAVVVGLAATKQMQPTTLILLGIALTQLFTALTAGLQYIANEEALAAIVRWTWGTVNGAVWYQVVTVAAMLAVALPFIQWRSSSVNAIAFAGDDAARSLGVPVTRVRLELIFVAVLLTAVTISFTGIIGFVGLVGPHIARLLIGPNHRFLLPFSAVVGGLLLVLADAVGRVVLAPALVPAGIVDALIGAPVFLYLILVRKKAF
ncbi:iron ABC transporter permease [Nocardioides zeae]|uniref:Iron ABC transporter permease n=1 Tax=Nocardioides imazamoxiresistens TaxID=3231893 RepID=A0ABU3Q0H0_9ACTN|nr:iron ABC transporter permease [Nocardioides zeae]MDT9595018.1 iron ABC transporter permease [Nocardioides zeae]